MLGLLGHASKVISRDILSTACLCFHKPSVDEIQKMYSKESEEIQKPHSYLPYCRSMNLVTKSPYSVQMNPNFYTYYTSLLACMKNPWGLNSVHLQDAPAFLIMNTTIRIAYLMQEDSVSKLRIYANAPNPAKESSTVEEGTLDDPPSPGVKATNWANRMLEAMYLISLQDLQEFMQAFKVGEVREKSLGELLKNFVPTKLNKPAGKS